MIEPALDRFRNFARDMEATVLVDINTEKRFPENCCPLGLKTLLPCPGPDLASIAWLITCDEAAAFIHGYDGPLLPILTDKKILLKYWALGILYRKWAAKRQGLGGLYEEEA